MTAAAILSRSLRRTMGMTELAALVGRGGVGTNEVRDALAAALDDPSLDLLVSGRDGEFVDRTGTARAIDDQRQGVVVLHGPGPVRSAIVYDRRLIGDRNVVEQAGELVALALDYERVNTELTAAQDELRASRLRIVEAGDQERVRIARDLHDAVQNRLVIAAMQAGRLAVSSEGADAQAIGAVRDEIDLALSELRRLVHGVMPALLVERGLYDALEDLADRMPVPVALDVRARPDVSASVATAAYFVTAEALSNVVKHADASRAEVVIDADRLVNGRSAPVGALRIEVRDDGRGDADLAGTGMRGMADRAEALGGQFLVRSTPGIGTELVMRLPCGS